MPQGKLLRKHTKPTFWHRAVNRPAERDMWLPDGKRTTQLRVDSQKNPKEIDHGK